MLKFIWSRIIVVYHVRFDWFREKWVVTEVLTASGIRQTVFGGWTREFLLLVGGSVCKFAGCACSCVGAGGKRRWWRWVAEGCNERYTCYICGSICRHSVCVYSTHAFFLLPGEMHCPPPHFLSVMEYWVGIAPHSISHFLPFALLLSTATKRGQGVGSLSQDSTGLENGWKNGEFSLCPTEEEPRARSEAESIPLVSVLGVNFTERMRVCAW